MKTKISPSTPNRTRYTQRLLAALLALCFLLSSCGPPVKNMAIALSPEPRLGQPFNILVSGENTVYRYVKVPEGVEVLPDQPDVIAMTAPVYDFTRTGTIQLQINAPGTYTIDVLALAPPSGDGQARDARRAQVEISDQGTVVTISNISSDGFLLIPASPTP